MFSLAMALKLVAMDVLVLLLKINDGNQFVIVITNKCSKLMGANSTGKTTATKPVSMFLDVPCPLGHVVRNPAILADQ